MNIAALVALFGVATPAQLDSPRIEETSQIGGVVTITITNPGPASTDITMVNTGVTAVSAGGPTQDVDIPAPLPGKHTHTYAHLVYGDLTADSNEIVITGGQN